MFIITFSCARFINKIFYFAKVYVFYLIAKAFVVNYSKTQRFSMFIGVLKPLPRSCFGKRPKVEREREVNSFAN